MNYESTLFYLKSQYFYYLLAIANPRHLIYLWGNTDKLQSTA